MNKIFELLAKHDVTMTVDYMKTFRAIRITFTKYSEKEHADVHYRITYSMDTLAEQLFIEVDIEERLRKFLSSDKFAVSVRPVVFIDKEPATLGDPLAKPGRMATHYYIDYGCGIAVFVTPDEDMVIPRFLYRAKQLGLQVGYRPSVLRKITCPIGNNIYECMEENGEMHYWEDEN